MSFTMSGSGSWSYNRFDEYEAKLKAQKEAEAAESVEEEVEAIEEGIDPKGAARIDAAKKKKKADVFAYDRKLQAQGKLKGKKIPPAPVEEQVEQIDERLDDMPKGDVGHERHKKAMADNQSAIDAANKRIAKMGIQYPTGKKQKTSVAKRKEAEAAKLKKEDLEATGLFSAEEIEALLEASCGSKGYQKGGEVKCEKCGGKGCDACEKKKDEKKGKSGGSKPDYLDFDKDGNKDEPMKDALKSKKGKKEDEEGEEGGEGAVSESVTATQRSNSFADAYASMYEAAPLAAMAGKALAGGAKLAGKAALAGGKAAVKGAASAAASAATAPKETASTESAEE